ncbi:MULTISPECIES: EAL domain-containing protein [unclassified Roseitalea]|uniref:putative bifunctional diguanylate cyclase/phosphodiesterase n=1 Tax=unclassified Roseitalea TaxID=2639107 RepID=UPI00273F69CD|nr:MULTISPECIES: EAL domain-containing protein [unclassified Roseitalea]
MNVSKIGPIDRLKRVLGDGHCATGLEHDKLVAAQIEEIGRRTPAMVALSFFAAGLLLYQTAGEPGFARVCALIAGFSIAHASTFIWWLNRRQDGRAAPDDDRVIRSLVLLAALLGCFWGLLTIAIFPMRDAETTFAFGVVLTGGVLVTTFHLSTLTPAMVVFVTTSGLLAGAGLLQAASPEARPMFLALVGLYVVFLPWMSRQFAAAFASRLATHARNQQQARIINHLLDDYQETASEWYWESDAAGATSRISPRLCDALGTSREAIVGSQFVTVIGGKADDQDTGLARLSQAMAANRAFRGVEIVVNLDGRQRWWRLSGKPRHVDEEATGFIGTCSDITAEKRAERQINELAHTDTLTGLFNRGSFTQRLDASVRTLERYGTAFTLLFLDLDKFKLVNDTYGHPVGDKLLIEVANRIRGQVREQDCVARLGGDEFAIILHNQNDAVLAAKLASRLIASVLEPYRIDGHTLWIGVSIGIALTPMHGTQPEQILRNADLALYRAKEDGRGVFRYFEAQMDFEQRERRILEQEMHQALDESEFRLRYQPMIDTQTGRVSSVEALIRWEHPIRGEIPPDEFIHIAEQSNLIVEIGKWTLRESCRAAMSWPDEVSVSVNIAATHFMRSDIVADVKTIVGETGFDPGRLSIEITESLLIEETDDVFSKLMALKEFGCAVVMDDFGTGYSSLSYLMKFPFDRLKIDRSFVRDLSDNEGAREILRAIAALGDNLGINITVEGVETTDQLDFVTAIACDQVQGFYFSRPLHGEQVNSFILRRLAGASIVAPPPAGEAERVAAG